ncbi:MAG: von willebrand factor type a [Methylobacterium sp. CG08_land_8_20_14_0_20_71_15]|nr:MAG: von willebrand factor type a [Methylobacterium sp. CG09_land_8_20_14_0_10_71_15]PIU12120.1 MAG: von willebrand factor type a [Methylobacterium sp. CG08_land_8_20_14_0_20_71_15]
MIFGLTSIPLLFFAGAAVDYGLATRLETRLQAATDATALTLCQTANTTTLAQMQIQAQSMMEGYMGSSGLTVDPLAMSLNPRQITLTTHAVATTYFNKITRVNSTVVGAAARCATPVPKTFEIALVLDNTGSMAISSGGQSKLQAAQTAAKQFIDYVKGNAAFAADTRISIVPFASAVAVNPTTYRYASWIDQQGKSSLHWTNVTDPDGSNFKSRFDIFAKLQNVYSGWGWGGCFETLPYPRNVSDVAPTGDNDSLYVPMFAPDEPGDGTTGSQKYKSSGTNYYSLNSYIDDGDSSGSCKSSSSMNWDDAQSRACKYVSPKDASPTNSGASGVPNGPNYGCTTKPLQRLTTDATVLKSLVDSMAPLGSTNIHEGFMWGWRTLSPNSVFADGASYSSSTVNKIIILMTDGENSWPTYSSSWNQSQYFAAGYLRNANGSTPNPRLPPGNQNVSNATNARAALDALTATACTNAKTAGISVYTIGFSVPNDPIDAQGLSVLSKCASSASQYFVANDSSSLIAAFDQIAKSIGTLRLTQ